MSRRQSRRRFMQTTAAVGAGFWVAGGIAPRESRSALEEIRFASIGVNGKGASDSADAGNNGKMVAICDIDDQSLNKAAVRFEDAKKYNDFRKMFDEMEKSIDAVTVSTPDHTHAVASVAAMTRGKHCFTQKPMTKSIYEARLLSHLAVKHKVATSMGNQGTANKDLREAAAIIKSGVLGKVSEVHVWTNRPVWPQGTARPTDAPATPAHIHWDLFLGPAEKRPYHEVYHPFKWRGWWAFGTGALGDMACHTLNMPYMGLNLRDPVSVQAVTSGHNKETFPSWSIITFEFPKMGERDALQFKWYDGGKRPTTDLFKKAEELALHQFVSKGTTDKEKEDKAKQFRQRMTSGALVVGEKGYLLSPGDYAGDDLYFPEGITRPSVEIISSPGHFEEWVRAIKGGVPATANFPNYAGPLTETVLLGNLAVWAAAGEPGQAEVTGKKIEWDAAKLEAKNAPEVAHIVKPEYHNGYQLEPIA